MECKGLCLRRGEVEDTETNVSLRMDLSVDVGECDSWTRLRIPCHSRRRAFRSHLEGSILLREGRT